MKGKSEEKQRKCSPISSHMSDVADVTDCKGRLRKSRGNGALSAATSQMSLMCPNVRERLGKGRGNATLTATISQMWPRRLSAGEVQGKAEGVNHNKKPQPTTD